MRTDRRAAVRAGGARDDEVVALRLALGDVSEHRDALAETGQNFASDEETLFDVFREEFGTSGITEEQLSLSTSISYTKDVDDALARVRAGEMQVALVLNPTALGDVITIASHKCRRFRTSVTSRIGP